MGNNLTLRYSSRHKAAVERLLARTPSLSRSTRPMDWVEGIAAEVAYESGRLRSHAERRDVRCADAAGNLLELADMLRTVMEGFSG